MHTQNDIHKISTASPLVYNNMGWLGDSFHRGQGRYEVYEMTLEGSLLKTFVVNNKNMFNTSDNFSDTK